MKEVPFVITEEEDGEWELAELDAEQETKQLQIVLGQDQTSEMQESLAGRQKAMLERWKDYP